MEATDVFLEELTVDGLVDGVPPTIHKLERKLFEAIKKGDLEKVKNALNYSQPKCNLNCFNNSGKTVVQVAADLEEVSIRNDIIKSLLSCGADLELALLHAVREKNVKCVETLIKFQEPPSVQPDTSYATNSSKRERYITPLILAACLQDFQIVKLLLENGFAIADLPTDSSRRSHGVEGEKLGPAVFRLNRYRALASPVYIAASFLQNSLNGPDPVYQACVLNKELCEMAEQEYEFRKEYLELSDGCKEFAVAVLNECRSMKEIRCVMEMKNEAMLPNTGGGLLNILEFAIVTRNEKFVSHPFSQLLLNSEIYRDVAFLEKSSWKQFALILLAFGLFPFFLVFWLVFDNCLPSHKVGRMLHSPCVKFLINCGSFQTFLFLLFLSSFAFQSIFLQYAVTDWLILFFVLGHLVDLVKQIYHKGRVRFFTDYWNYLALATVILFLLHYAFWWAGRAGMIRKLESLTWQNHATHGSYMILLFSDCLFAVAILLAFTQNLSYIQANSTIGPLLHAFIQMLFDVMKFFFYFIFVFLAFVVSFTKLYLQYEKAREFFLPGSNQTDPLHLDTMLGSVRTIFWSLFGQIDPGSFQLEEGDYNVIWKTGLILFGAFNIVAVLVALNMLIAILNDSYVQITVNRSTGYAKPYKALCFAVIGWFSTAVNCAFQSSLFRWVVLSAVCFFGALMLLCFLIVGIHASGISIPLSLLML